jgi:hypothetical protein
MTSLLANVFSLCKGHGLRWRVKGGKGGRSTSKTEAKVAIYNWKVAEKHTVEVDKNLQNLLCKNLGFGSVFSKNLGFRFGTVNRHSTSSSTLFLVTPDRMKSGQTTNICVVL